MKELGLPIS